MTSSRPPDRLDVPVARLADGRGSGRRAGAALAVVALVLGGAFGLARLADRPTSTTEALALASSSARPAAAGPSVGGQPTRPPLALQRSPRPRIEALPDVPSVPLAGAPEVTIVSRTGSEERDLRIDVWTPADSGTRTIGTIPRAVPSAGDTVFPIVAPDRRHVLLLGLFAGPATSNDTARLLAGDGTVLWRGDRLASSSGALWSADGRTVVVAGDARRWSIVTIDRPGVATERRLTLPTEVYLPNPMPIGSLSVPRVEPRTVPVGFSADGGWIYGVIISPDIGIVTGEFRVSIDGARIEPLVDLRTGAADGLVPRPGTLGERIVDGVTGRVASSRINSNTLGGPPTLEVQDPAEGFVFSVDASTTLGSSWGADGRLYALTADAPLFPNAIELRAYDADGAPGAPILSVGPLGSASLIGVRDGYAVIALLATRPTRAGQLVAVDVTDPSRITALPIDLDNGSPIVAVSLDR